MGLSWVAFNMKSQTSAVVFWPVIHTLAVGDDSTAIPSVCWLLLPDRTAVEASSFLAPFPLSGCGASVELQRSLLH